MSQKAQEIAVYTCGHNKPVSDGALIKTYCDIETGCEGEFKGIAGAPVHAGRLDGD